MRNNLVPNDDETIEKFKGRMKLKAIKREDDGRDALPPEYSDDALASDFTRRHGADLRYVAAWGKWLLWNGSRWAEDRITRVFDLVRAVCRDNASKAKAEERIARQLASGKTIAAVERLARSDPQHATLPEAFDADDFLLNTPGGTVDLRTGETRPHRREDLLTKITAVTPNNDGDATTWRRFLSDVTCGDREIEKYLQRLIGYCLTGDVRDHVLVFFHGTGANGKSTFLDLLLHILGTYAKAIPAETLTEARGERHPTDVANLNGLRLAVSSELEEGQHWAEARVKSLTGDAMLSGRFMRTDFFEFRRTHKHVIAGNHRPAIRVVDEAIRRRIHLVPFLARFSAVTADRDMPAKLQGEASAILSWAVKGCMEWQASGLNPPAAVIGATADYLESQDTLGLWIGEDCDTSDPTAETRSSGLYASFRQWKETRGERAPSQVRFSAQLEARFRKARQGSGHIVFSGIGLK